MIARDHEVLDLLRDEPELLAVADAVVETLSVRRGWVVVGRWALVLIALAAVVVFLFARYW